jgi:Na+-translocating ferredoxin:NAD+ oxidoreductase RnfG subunit
MEAIAVAVIAAVGGILAALVQKGRKENKEDHNVVAGLLSKVKDDIIDLHHKIDHVDEQVDKVDDKLDGHIDWHMKKIEKEKSQRRRQSQ